MAKKIILISIIISMCFLSVYGKGILALTGNIFISSDSEYKEIYNKNKYFPGILGEYEIYKGLFAWADFSSYSNAGITSGDLKTESITKRSFLSFGLGYETGAGEKIRFKFKTALSKVSYKEEALDLEITGNTVGFKVGGDILIKINKIFIIFVGAEYFFGNDTASLDEINLDVKLSGLTSRVGIGIQF